jgi:hypothetical protein
MTSELNAVQLNVFVFSSPIVVVDFQFQEPVKEKGINTRRANGIDTDHSHTTINANYAINTHRTAKRYV